MVWSFVLAGAAEAATVNYIQTSVNDADGTTIGAVASDQWLETAISYSTATAPASWSSYHFTHWSNDSYPEDSYRDAWGRSLNPISFHSAREHNSHRALSASHSGHRCRQSAGLV